MSEPRHDLDKIQRWMQEVIMHPGGVVAGMEGDAARQHIEIDPQAIEQVVSPSRAVSAVDRLEIYARAYYARLIDCLRAEFPMMVEALGEPLFDDFAVAYLQQHPSRSYTLDHLGREFANYLAETRRDGDAWLDFLPDLARFEWNIAEVFDGPGCEGQALLTGDQLRSLSAESWPAARLVAVPCLRVLQFDFPVDAYYRQLRGQQEAPPPEREETFVAVTRRDYVVRHFRVTAAEHALLSAVIAGESVGQALMRAAEHVPESEIEAFAGTLQSSFRRWAADGLFAAVLADG